MGSKTENRVVQRMRELALQKTPKLIADAKWSQDAPGTYIWALYADVEGTQLIETVKVRMNEAEHDAVKDEVETELKRIIRQ